MSSTRNRNNENAFLRRTKVHARLDCHVIIYYIGVLLYRRRRGEDNRDGSSGPMQSFRVIYLYLSCHIIINEAGCSVEGFIILYCDRLV